MQGLFPEVERRMLGSLRPLPDHLLRDPSCREPDGHGDQQRKETGSCHVRSATDYVHNMVIVTGPRRAGADRSRRKHGETCGKRFAAARADGAPWRRRPGTERPRRSG